MRRTGITLNDNNYVEVMAIDAASLAVNKKLLATELCRMLAQIYQLHLRKNKVDRADRIASVAIPLGTSRTCNQRSPIIQEETSEHDPG